MWHHCAWNPFYLQSGLMTLRLKQTPLSLAYKTNLSLSLKNHSKLYSTVKTPRTHLSLLHSPSLLQEHCLHTSLRTWHLTVVRVPLSLGNYREVLVLWAERQMMFFQRLGRSTILLAFWLHRFSAPWVQITECDFPLLIHQTDFFMHVALADDLLSIQAYLQLGKVLYFLNNFVTFLIYPDELMSLI